MNDLSFLKSKLIIISRILSAFFVLIFSSAEASMENHDILQFFERGIVDQTEITYRKKNHNIDLIQFSDANLRQYDELNVFKEKIKRATGIAIKHRN